MREPHSNNSSGEKAERARGRGREGGTGVAPAVRDEGGRERNVRG